MKWYYVHSGRQAGPVEEHQLTELLDSGKIQPDTLVWHEAMPDWKPYEEAIPKTVATKSLVLPAPLIAPPIRARRRKPIVRALPEAVCSECGRMFSIESTTKIGESRVCANCKPRLLQKFNEKGRVEGVLSYAGFLTRFAAYFVDRIIVGAVISTLLWATGASGNSHTIFQQSGFSGLTLFIFVFSIFLPMAYETFMVGKYRRRRWAKWRQQNTYCYC